MIPLVKSTFTREAETKKALCEFILRTQKLSMGEECLRFEKGFAAFQGEREAVCFNSGTSANVALLQTLKSMGRLKAGDRVGVSGLTWPTNVSPLILMGFEPIPIDCDPQTLNVMSRNLEERIRTECLKALFVTNVLGFAGDLPEIKTLCDEQGILLIEDNCESLGTEIQGKKTGTFGEMSSFSFFVSHHLSTIEGGMVTTHDPQFADMLRAVRSNGWDRHRAFFDLGFNFKPTEITGFLGAYQLPFLEDLIASRERHYRRLEALSNNNPDFMPINTLHLSRISSYAFPVICRTPALKAVYAKAFLDAGVELRPVLAGNIQRQPFYCKYVSKKFDLPDADQVHACGFYFCNDPDLSKADFDLLSALLSRQGVYTAI